jgi:hypothetical protein
MKIDTRFWPKVRRGKEDECWLWMGASNPKGYGHIRYECIYYQAHRVSWEMHYGLIPKGKWILHKCDNPGCVNPKHLFIGDVYDNNLDMYNKGRAALDNGRKLSDEQVHEIRYLIDEGSMTQRCIASIYGISPATICMIGRRQTWRNL